MNLHDMPGMDVLRSVTLGDPSVSIALIDGSPDATHPCFDGARLTIVPVPASTEESEASLHEHATAIASTIIGQPGCRAEGVAPGVTLEVLENARTEEEAASEIGLARSLELALALEPDIIHCAFCIPSQTSTVGGLLGQAIDKVAAAGVLLVAPSGNNAGACRCSPADQPSVLAVGGLDDDGSVRDASNDGRAYLGHGVMSWAEDLLTAIPGGEIKRQSGTSGAAAIVTGVAALLLSAARQAGVPTSPLAVGEAIVETARPVEDPATRDRAIGGALDPAGALRAVLGSGEFTAARPGVTPSLRLPSRLFALGELGVDLPDDGARARLAARMGRTTPAGLLDVARAEDVRALHAHLRSQPGDAALLTWVLTIDGLPVYALDPAGDDAAAVHRRLIAVLGVGAAAADGQPRVERMSVPGTVLTEQRALRDGTTVPVVGVRRAAGISAWRTADLAVAAVGHDDPESVVATADLLSRIYEGHRNLGTHGPDRALNHAGTNTVQAATAVAQAAGEGLCLQRLSVDKSRLARPRSECWDVQAWFHDPDHPRRAPHVWIWTVDVADELPVPVGIPRHWICPPE